MLSYEDNWSHIFVWQHFAEQFVYFLGGTFQIIQHATFPLLAAAEAAHMHTRAIEYRVEYIPLGKQTEIFFLILMS